GRDQGPERPDLPAFAPGVVFPMYHVFADLSECRGGRVLACRSSEPLATIGLAMSARAGLRLLAANLTEEAREVTVEGLPQGEVAIRRLDHDSVVTAMRESERFRDHQGVLETRGGSLDLELNPYAVVRLDMAVPRGRH